MKDFIKIPQGVNVRFKDTNLIVKGPKGELSRMLFHPDVKISVEGDSLKFVGAVDNKNLKKMIGTFQAHAKNMFKGVTDGYTYKMKICASHFPMSASVEKENFVVKNLLGEKTPRKTRVYKGVTIKVQGTEISIEGSDKELVAQQSANIEQLTRRPGFDRRIFQDGIYITSKAGKEMK